MQNSAKIKFRLGQVPVVAEMLLYKYGAWIVLLVALLYYAQYYRSGLNLSGEGGTTAVIAMRMLEGQKPISEIFLGYNVMWFYPVAWLFQITGPSYIALRIYFFVLCGITALLAFFVVRKCTNRGWYALLIAMGPLLIPGMIFRNYMGFLTLLNMLCLLQAYVFPQSTRLRQLLWMAAAGGAVGLTFLVRVELGLFFTIICLGLIVLYPFGWRAQIRQRIPEAAAGLVLLVAMFFATHTPVYLDAQKRGFATSFTEQYMGWVGLIRAHAENKMAPPVLTPKPAESAALPALKVETAAPSTGDEAAKESGVDDLLYLALYLPIPISLLIIFPCAVLLLRALWQHNFALRTQTLALLITTGCSLTLFAQYFFFRPDTPHLSEFMVPFTVAMACAVWMAVQMVRHHSSLLVKLVGSAFVLLCLGDAALYFIGAYPKESAGTIAASRKRSHEFSAENDVRVLLKKKEVQEFKALYDVVMRYSGPDDYVVCYPYAPTVNFMTNRRSYEYNLYVDDLHHEKNFHHNTVQEMASLRPAVILIEDRDINKNGTSRFSNWAAQTYAHIRENYRYAGTFRRQEIYIRPDLYDQSPQTLPTP